MVPEIKKILFTSDLTESSRHAFTYAASLAGRYCAQIVFLYVMEDIPTSAKAFLDETIISKMRQKAADNARSTLLGKRRDMAMVQYELQRFCDSALEGGQTDRLSPGGSDVVVTDGNVVDAIIETAEQYDCDTIVMGPTRRSALSKAVLGSVVRGVLTRTDRLVVIAPPPSRRH